MPHGMEKKPVEKEVMRLKRACTRKRERSMQCQRSCILLLEPIPVPGQDQVEDMRLIRIRIHQRIHSRRDNLSSKVRKTKQGLR